MKEKFFEALTLTYENTDVEGFTALLFSMDEGRIDIPFHWFIDLIKYSQKNTPSSHIDRLKEGIWRILLLPTNQKEYPIITYAKDTEEDELGLLLKMIDNGFWHLSAVDSILEMGSNLIDPDDITALKPILAAAGPELKKALYRVAIKDGINWLARYAIMHHALDHFDPRCIEELKNHKLSLQEIWKDFSTVSIPGFFALLHRKEKIECDMTITGINILERKPIKQMLALRYYYETGVPEEEWGKIRKILNGAARFEVRMIALELFAKYHPNEPRRILEYYDRNYQAMKRYPYMDFFSKKPIWYSSFLKYLLYGINYNPKHGDVGLLGLVDISCEENISTRYDTKLFDITLDLFESLEKEEALDEETAKRYTLATLKKVLELPSPNKRYIKKLCNWAREFDLVSGRRYFIKCFGGEAVAVVTPVDETRSAFGYDGIYGELTFCGNKFKVIELLGTVQGYKKYYIEDKYEHRLVELHAGEICNISHENIIYFNVEDALKAIFDE